MYIKSAITASQTAPSADPDPRLKPRRRSRIRSKRCLLCAKKHFTKKCVRVFLERDFPWKSLVSESSNSIHARTVMSLGEPRETLLAGQSTIFPPSGKSDQRKILGAKNWQTKVRGKLRSTFGKQNLCMRYLFLRVPLIPDGVCLRVASRSCWTFASCSCYRVANRSCCTFASRSCWTFASCSCYRVANRSCCTFASRSCCTFASRSCWTFASCSCYRVASHSCCTVASRSCCTVASRSCCTVASRSCCTVATRWCKDLHHLKSIKIHHNQRQIAHFFPEVQN